MKQFDESGKIKNNFGARQPIVLLVAFALTLLIFETNYFVKDVLSKNISPKSVDQLIVDTKALDGAEPRRTYLSAKGENEGFGVARRLDSDGHFIHTVDATLPALGDGEKYLGWLAQDENFQNSKSTGELIVLNDEYFLVYQDTNPMVNYNYVAVTKSKGNGGFDPEDVVLTGKF